MKNKIYTLTGFIVVILAFYAYWQAAFVLPQKIETYIIAIIQSHLDEASFEYERKESGLTYLSFHEIKLDKDGFSRIEKIDISYSPFSLFFSGRISEIQILVPDITLSVKESVFHASLQRLLASPAPRWIYALDTLGVEGGRLNLLTENWGSLRINIDGIIRTTDDDKSAQFQIDAAQKQLSGSLKLSGVLSQNRNWHIDGVLDDGRLDNDSLQLSRVTGQMTFDSAGEDVYFAKSELSIGGLRAPSGHALDNIAASYELDQNGFNFVGAGKALGFDNIELGLAYNSDKADVYTGTVFASSLPELVSYYKGQRGALGEIDNKRLLQNVFFAYEVPIDSLWLEQKHILLRFERLNIADFAPVFNGNFYGNGVLRGAVKVKISPDGFTIGGFALESRNGNFVFERPLLKQLSKKIKDTPQSAVFLNKVDDFHYKTLGVTVTGADEKKKVRQISIRLRGSQGGEEDKDQDYTFTYEDNLVWLWHALLGYPQD